MQEHINIFPPLTEQTVLFLTACALGAILGVAWDVFRIARLAAKPGKLALAVQDIVYVCLWAVALFWFATEAAGGQLRAFHVAGTALGWILYYFTLGRIVYAAAGAILRVIRKILHTLSRLFILPLRRLFRWIGGHLGRFSQMLKEFFKKGATSLKIGLKRRAKVVYNGCIQPRARKREVRRRGKPGKRLQKNKA